MNKKFKLAALLFGLVFLFSGCSFVKPPEEEVLPYMFEINTEYGLLKNGRLIFTVNRFWTIDNIEDLPEKGGIRDDGFIYIVYNTDKGSVAINYPELVQEDGSFARETYMLMVDFTVTSEDAEEWTSNDQNEKGNPKGRYPDPYIFDIGGSIVLGPSGTGSRYGTLAYFSELYAVPEGNGYQFRLMPGETIDLTIGFFVNENKVTGNPYELSELTLWVTNNSLGATIPVEKNIDGN